MERGQRRKLPPAPGDTERLRRKGGCSGTRRGTQPGAGAFRTGVWAGARALGTRRAGGAEAEAVASGNTALKGQEPGQGHRRPHIPGGGACQSRSGKKATAAAQAGGVRAQTHCSRTERVSPRTLLKADWHRSWGLGDGAVGA